MYNLYLYWSYTFNVDFKILKLIYFIDIVGKCIDGYDVN